MRSPAERATGDGPWRLPPEDLALSEREIHVWRACLDQPPVSISALRKALAPDELARADRYRFPNGRDRFVVCRAALRTILGLYLRAHPDHLRLSANSYGKPELAGLHSGSALRFNVSHSGDLALLAVGYAREVGVDLERLRPGRPGERMRLAERFFSPAEAAELRALPEDERDDAFTVCWTRKEAYIKAIGRGLSLPLSMFDVTVSPKAAAALLRTAWNPQDASRWLLRDLNPGSGYVGAIAVEGGGWRLRRWQWSW